MKQSIVFIINFIFWTFSANAQVVGIGTRSPQNVFHIDAKSNTIGNSDIQDDIVITTNGYIGFGTLTPTQRLDIKGDVIIDQTDKVTGNLTTQKLYINQTLRVNKSDLLNVTDKLELYANGSKKAFRLDDGSQKINNIPLKSMIPSLAVTPPSGGATDFMAFWTNLPSVTEMKIGTLNNNLRIGNYGASTVTNITTSTLTLNEGIWLVMAKCACENQSSNTTSGLNVYLSLREGSTIIAQNAAASETSGWAVSTPQLEYLVKVKPSQTRTFNIGLSTSINQNTYKTTTNFGGSYFFAIRLDYVN